MKSIAAVMTVHNRKEKTLDCLASLNQQEKLGEEFDVSVYLTDDGSTDGTAGAVRKRYPDVNILNSSGDLYWNRGMHLAFGKALEYKHDFYLWVNDDTVIFPDALTRIISTSSLYSHNAIIAGSTQDPETYQRTYSGVIRLHPARPMHFTPVEPQNEPVPIETMNGNCVLIPKSVAKNIGNLDPVFSHAMGDFDYGLRAQQKGIQVILAPGYYGFCKKNKNDFKGASIVKKLINLMSKKGLPPKDWAIFTKRYAGPLWPIYWVSPYIRQLFNP